MLGYLLIIAGNASLALGLLFIRLLTNPKDNTPLNPYLLTSLMVICGAIILAPIAISSSSEVLNIISKEKSKFIQIVLAGLFYIVLGEMCFNIGLSKLDENALSVGGLLALSFPLFTALLGALFLKEDFNMIRFIIALGLMSTGFIVFVTGK
jgi:drug/metabolite transporter (DMT)-like permease